MTHPGRVAHSGAALVVSIVMLFAAVPQWMSAHAAPPSTQRTRTTILAFIRAYNRHDVLGTLQTLGSHVQYWDCDYGAHTVHYTRTRSAAARWIRARFADGDLLGHATIDGIDGSAAGVAFTRTSNSLTPLIRGGKVPVHEGYKFLVNGAGTKIITLEMALSAWCAAGDLPVGSEPNRERLMADRFLRVYASGDVAGVVSLLSPNASYVDCDTVVGSHGRYPTGSALTGFLAQGMRIGDQFASQRYILDSWESEPPNSPLTVVIDATRLQGTGGAAPHPVEIRLVLNRTSDTFDVVDVYAQVPGCQVGSL